MAEASPESVERVKREKLNGLWEEKVYIYF
jgi:hypothetical protein